MSSTNSIPMNSPARSRALLGDKVLLVAALISGVAAAVIGYFYYEPMLGMVGGLLLSAMAAGVYFTARGTLFSRLALTTLQVALVALHIQLAHGEVEYHFGVFVTMSLLLVYLDWAPVLLAAALYAVHHVLFDRLQAAGLGFYCLSEPDFARVLLHAGYVVIQTGLEIVLLVGMGRMAKEGGELAAMVASVNQADGIALDVSGLRVSSPLAQSLQSTLQRMQTVVASVQQSTAHIETASEEISRGHQELASRTEAAASNLEQTAASMEEINSTMKSSADSARTASQLAVANAEVAQRGGQVVGQVVATMEEINQSSRKIHDIIGTIDGIAFQT
ncbi:MAG: chemotaxis protein, partial [Hydrogenophaga sp.]|nr:chemotaxis protein [Hydrogenophaga sp.]